ncbi:unnamed protein product [Rotaria sp. Silwood2]|nr:unnamed protein product [Rotaria sp. Silwood2]
MTFTSRLKATEFDPLLIDYKVQSLLYMETKIQSLKIIDFLHAQPLAYHNYEQDEKIPQAKHKQLEMYLYGLENNNNQIQQTDLLIYELFNKCVQQHCSHSY